MSRHRLGRLHDSRIGGGTTSIKLVLIGTLALVGILTYWLMHSRKPMADWASRESSIGTAVDTSEPVEPAKPQANLDSPNATFPRARAGDEAQKLVATLAELGATHAVTIDQASAWKQTLDQLISLGQDSVPAIREFLDKKDDVKLYQREGGGNFGYHSLRVALLDALHRIGGPDAVRVLLGTLHKTADPAEIAVIATYLAQDDVGRHQDAILSAARASLDLAMSDPSNRWDVAPLFDLLRKYDGEGAVHDLKKYAKPWFIYAPIVLAELPDGAGVTSLVRFARSEDPAGGLGEDIVHRMLAQLALQYKEAADALVMNVKSNGIRQSAWAGVAAALEGYTLVLTRTASDPVRSLEGEAGQGGYHIEFGNQNFTQNPPQEMTSEQVRERIQFIDKLLLATSNQAAIDQLQKARSNLSARLAQ